MRSAPRLFPEGPTLGSKDGDCTGHVERTSVRPEAARAAMGSNRARRLREFDDAPECRPALHRRGQPPLLQYNPRCVIPRGVDDAETSGGSAWAVELLPCLRRLTTVKYGIPAQDADDVVQSAILDFLLQARRYETSEPGLLVVIARRRCMDYWRNRKLQLSRMIPLERVPDDDRHVVQGDAYAEGLIDGITLAFGWVKITPRCQQLLSERFLRQTRSREIARAIGEKREAVKRHMSRCLEKLRLLMEARTA